VLVTATSTSSAFPICSRLTHQSPASRRRHSKVGSARLPAGRLGEAVGRGLSWSGTRARAIQRGSNPAGGEEHSLAASWFIASVSMRRDVIQPDDEPAPRNGLLAAPAVRDGTIAADLPPVSEIQRQASANVEALPHRYRRFTTPRVTSCGGARAFWSYASASSHRGSGALRC
jgi:hypothetical protein